MSLSELEALIDMLNAELEGLRRRNDPANYQLHKNTRILLTLAQEIQQLKSPSTSEGSSNE